MRQASTHNSRAIESHSNLPQLPLGSSRVLYVEDVYVGCRYWEQVEVSPLFAFDHGLSYTTFLLSGLELHIQTQQDHISVRCTLTNTGSRADAEVIQVYIAPVSPLIKRPIKGLKAFTKRVVQPTQSVNVEISIDMLRDTSFWEKKTRNWSRL